MGSNRAHTLLLVVFVSAITLILSMNYVFAINPTANAGIDQTVNDGDTVTLDGTASSDPDGKGIKSYAWTQTKGDTVTLDLTVPSQPTFTAPSLSGNKILQFSLIVTDDDDEVSTADSVNVVVMSAKKFNPNSNKDGDKIKTSHGLGQIITGKAFGIKISNPGSLVSGFVHQLAVTTSVDGTNVDFNFTQSPSGPPGQILPDILTAIFLDLGFTESATDDPVFTAESDFLAWNMPQMQFTINSDFESLERFTDGCPVVSLELLDEGSGIWGTVDGSIIANTNKIFVSNSDADGTLSVIDGSTNNLEATISVGTNPIGLSFNDVTKKLYVANNGSGTFGTVSVIDTLDSNSVTEISIGSFPAQVAVNPVTNKVYVTNGTTSGTAGTVTVIDGTSKNIDATILVGVGPFGIAVDTTLNKVFVANKLSNTVTIINGANNAFIKNIAVTQPVGVAIDSSNSRVYVTNGTSGTDGHVIVIDSSGESILDKISVGKNPTGLSFNNATKKLYVANNGGPGSVSIIDTTIGFEIAEVMTDSGTFAVEANPNTNRIFVANSGKGTVSVIDGIPGSTTENTVIGTIKDDSFSNNFGIALNPTVPNPVRDPSLDELTGKTIDECAYIATPPHFSKFAIGGIKALAVAGSSLFSGGGGGGGSAPSFSDSTVASFGTGSDGFGVILSDTNQNLLENTATLSTGEKNMFRFDLAQYRGINGLAHVGFFLNLRGDDFMAQKWDTYITFDKGEPLQVVDPNGYFSEVDFKILEKDATNLVLKYEITFAKPMEKSHLLLKAWDTYRTGSNNLLLDAIEVVEGEKQTTADESELLSDESGLLSDEPQLQETEISAELFESLDEAREGLNEAKAIPDWIKTSAGWWSEKKISDSDFVLGIEFLIKNDVITVPQTESEIKSSPQIPDWISANAGWWANEQISDEEFTQALQWLIANGVMRI